MLGDGFCVDVFGNIRGLELRISREDSHVESAWAWRKLMFYEFDKRHIVQRKKHRALCAALVAVRDENQYDPADDVDPKQAIKVVETSPDPDEEDEEGNL